MKYFLTTAQLAKLKKDSRNEETPFKIIASGIIQPLRFAEQDKAIDFYMNHKGTCLLSYSTNYEIKYLAYKYRGA